MIKNHWEVRKLKDICAIKTGKKDVNEGNPDGEYPFFTCAKEHTYSDSYSFDTEAILIAGNGDVGQVNYYKGKFEAYQRTYVLSNFINIIPEYLFIFLNGYLKNEVSKQKLGNTMPYIKMAMIAEFEIPIPPINEQEQIIKRVDKFSKKIEKIKQNFEKNLDNSREIFDSYFENVLLKAKQKNGETKLGEMCERFEYGTSAKSQQIGKVAVLRMGNIQNGKFDFTNLVYTSDTKEIEKYLLKYNDVLFNRTNSPELVGKTAIYKGEKPAIFAGYLIRIHRKENILDADFLNYFLNSKSAIKYGKSVFISSVHQANINGEKLKNYPIPKLSFREQITVAEKLNKLSSRVIKLEEIYNKKISDIEDFKKAILDKIFSKNL